MGTIKAPRHGHQRKIMRATCVSTLALVAALPANAQDTDLESEEAIEEIIVQGRINFFRPEDQCSATGCPLAIVDTPQAVTVLTEDLLDVAGIDSVGMATRLIPGVLSTLEGQGGAPSEVFSRGFLNDTREGYRLNGASFSRFQELDLAGVERIESVRGPSAIVFGQNSFGGILNIVTKKPTNDFRYGGSVSAGTFQNYRVEGDVSGSISDSVRGRLTAAYTDADSWTDGVENQTVALFPTLEVDIGQDTLLTLIGFYQETDGTTYGGLGLGLDADGNLATPGDIGLEPEVFFGFDAADNIAERKATYVAANIDHQFNDDLTGSLNVSFNRPDTYRQGIVTTGQIDSRVEDPSVLAFATTFDEYFEVFEVNADLNWTFDMFGNEQLVSIRAEYEDLENEETLTGALFTATGGPFSFFPFNASLNPGRVDPLSFVANNPFTDASLFSTESIEEISIGGQILLKPLDRLTVLAGARYDNISREVNITDFLRDDPLPQIFDVDNVTPRLGLIFELFEGANVYYSFSEGFSLRLVQDTSGAVPQDPETGQQHEVGFKALFLEDKVSFGINYYSIERDNVAVLQDIPNTVFTRLVNGRRQEHQGVEVEFVGSPVSGLDIIATYSYLDAEITQNLEDPDLVGNRVDRSNDHLASLYAQYEILSGPVEGLFLGAGITYTGEVVVNDENSFIFDPYTLVSANIGYPITDEIVIKVSGQNLTDEEYFVTDNGSLDEANFFGMPRSVTVTLSAEF